MKPEAMNEDNLFQVNLKGMISLLSEHIYSDPGTFVRELLQNCVDAITVLRGIDGHYEGRVDVRLLDDGTAVFQDNGVGLKKEEVYRFLTVIGESSKRNVPEADDFIGQFGIGLLSCFVVTDEILVESRSAMGGKPVCWRGRVNGTYELTTVEEDGLPVGSRVFLRPKKEWTHLFEYESIKKTLIRYGEILPYPIYLHYGGEEELVNTPNPIWMNPEATREELLDCGAEIFHSSSLDAFRVSTGSGRVSGVLYILPFRTQFSVRNSHRIYLKRMLLSEDDCNLLPSWAFFVRCLLNVDGLHSTASRESLVNDGLLKDARKEIGAAIKDYLRRLVEENRALFNRIVEIHYLHIKAIASEDDEMFRLFMRHLPFETNCGVRSFKHICSQGDVVYYTWSLEDFAKVRRVTRTQGWMVINAAYTFDEALLKKCARMNPEMKIEEFSALRLLEGFESAEDSPEHCSFKERADGLLSAFGCVCLLKRFSPADMPVIFMADDKDTTVKAANNPLAGVLDVVGREKRMPPTLTFNLNNPMVQTLLKIQGDNKLFRHVVHILYVQSLFQGKYPVSGEEMNLFNQALSELMTSKMNDFINFLN